MTNGITAEQLEAIERRLVAIQSTLGINDLSIVPKAATDPDGFPGNVAAGELVESAWGNTVADKSRKAPRGVWKRKLMLAPQNVSAGVETTLHDLGATAPPWPNRSTRITFGIRNNGPIVSPGGETSVTFLFRLTSPSGAVMSRHVFPWTPGQQTTDAAGVSFFGTTNIYPTTPGQAIYVNVLLGNTLSIQFGDNSWIQIEDVGPYPPPGGDL